MARMAAHSRRSLALALTLALTLISGSSLWHHDHDQSTLHQAQAGCRLDTLSLKSHQADGCPICLLQRLLAHTWVQAAKEAVAPAIIARYLTHHVFLPTLERSESTEARAPPLC